MNGLEALEKLLLDPVDLLIVDVNMPQMDGITFLRALRQQAEPTGSIPALVTSSEREAGDIETARAAGANFYLVKPVSQETLAVCAGLLTGGGA